MQNDDAIWNYIRHNNCSFLVEINTGIFIRSRCLNQYNVTGVCSRGLCPLANSRYATIRDHEGLYVKTIERDHMQNNLWERIKLSRNYDKSLEIIDKHLEYFPRLLVQKIKLLHTKFIKDRIGMEKFQLKEREKIMTVPRKENKREARREENAEKAAVLDNYPVEGYNNVLEMEGLQPVGEEEDDEEPEIEYVEGYDDLEEEDDMEDFGGFEDKTLKDVDHGDSDEAIEDMDADRSNKKRRGFSSDSGKVDKSVPDITSKRKGEVLIEVEKNDEVAVGQKAYF